MPCCSQVIQVLAELDSEVRKKLLNLIILDGECPSRKDVVKVSEELHSYGVENQMYHAVLALGKRKATHKMFVYWSLSQLLPLRWVSTSQT